MVNEGGREDSLAVTANLLKNSLLPATSEEASSNGLTFANLRPDFNTGS
jgi:hypothetical protein